MGTNHCPIWMFWFEVRFCAYPNVLSLWEISSQYQMPSYLAVLVSLSFLVFKSTNLSATPLQENFPVAGFKRCIQIGQLTMICFISLSTVFLKTFCCPSFQVSRQKILKKEVWFNFIKKSKWANDRQFSSISNARPSCWWWNVCVQQFSGFLQVLRLPILIDCPLWAKAQRCCSYLLQRQ